jgi:DNA-directed RNA polymerase I, II, and III subunit RPABC5
MIIPVKCFTCGKVLADKFRFYQQEVRKYNLRENKEFDRVEYLTNEYLKNKGLDKTAEGKVLDNLGLNSPCCRRHMLTHVDIE